MTVNTGRTAATLGPLLLAGLLAGLLGGCGSLPQPFAHQDAVPDLARTPPALTVLCLDDLPQEAPRLAREGRAALLAALDAEDMAVSAHCAPAGRSWTLVWLQDGGQAGWSLRDASGTEQARAIAPPDQLTGQAAQLAARLLVPLRPEALAPPRPLVALPLPDLPKGLDAAGLRDSLRLVLLLQGFQVTEDSHAPGVVAVVHGKMSVAVAGADRLVRLVWTVGPARGGSWGELTQEAPVPAKTLQGSLQPLGREVGQAMAGSLTQLIRTHIAPAK